MDGSLYKVETSVAGLLSGLIRQKEGLTATTLEPVVRKLVHEYPSAPERVLEAFASLGGLVVSYHDTGWYRFMGEGAFVFTFTYNGQNVTHIVHV